MQRTVNIGEPYGDVNQFGCVTKPNSVFLAISRGAGNPDLKCDNGRIASSLLQYPHAIATVKTADMKRIFKISLIGFLCLILMVRLLLGLLRSKTSVREIPNDMG